jgi:phytoene dehydrogenase-like protein
LRYGGIPGRSMLGIGSLTRFDPSRAPAGKATMQMWDYVPYEHPDGGHAAWDRLKTAHVEKMIERAAPYIENLNHDNILAYHSDSPVDMERTSPSFRHGDIHGVAPLAYQSGAHRPTPDLGQNTVPGIDGLYLVGPFQYPGGGVFGAGRGTAMRMFDDLGMNFDKISG